VLAAAFTAVTHLAFTPQEYPVVKEISDKANHIIAFYVLSLLVDFSFPENKLGFAKVIALLIYGLLIEVIQNFLPHRTSSLLDLVADGIGIAGYKFSLPVLRRIPLLRGRWDVSQGFPK
jgi:VanZ family protein